MISTILIPKLQQRFPERGLVVSVPPSPCATFPAIHPEVGDIQIYDEGGELTLIAGNFTHGHFSNYDDELSLEQHEEAIAEAVVDFLEALFDNQIVLWGSHKCSGGWHRIGADNPIWAKDVKRYLWSGPLPSDASER